jgi:hypothetical protein
MAVERNMGAGGIPEMLPIDDSPEAIVEVEQTQIGPEIVEMSDGSAIVGEFEEETVRVELPFDGNLADAMDSGELGTIASDLIGSIDDDLSSRKDWEDTYKKGIEFLGMKDEKRSEPFEGSSGIVHPLLAESVTQFQAQAYRELLPAQGPVRVQVFGEETEALTKQAERVQDYMNYMITCKMEEYDPELDQMLFYLPIIGSTFKKIYFNPLKNRAVSDFVHAEDLIVPYGVSDLASSPRITHRITMNSNEVRKLQLAGFYSDDVDLPSSGYESDEYSEVQESINDVQGVHPSNDSSELTLYEVHLNLDLEGFEDMGMDGEPTGLKLPYIVTILEDTSEVLSIRRNYEQQDAMKKQKHFFVHYKFLPGLGFYGLGLTHMIGGLAQASTSILRQLIDAGTLANLPAGFKARGARIRNDDEPLQPGEFRDIDVVSGDLRGALMPLPFKEPSGTLYNLLGNLVDAGRRFASMADLKVGEMGGDTPVGTTMAIMERGTKVMSAIHKRLHYSQKIEFKLLAEVFAKSMEPYPYIVSTEVGPEVKSQDFDGRVDVLPTSDPNIFSMSQRIALAQTQLQLVQSNPDIHGGPQGLYQAYRKMYEALGVSNIDSILPMPPQPQPVNAAKENQNSLLGVPLQAFAGQDHQAHIETHLAIMSTPAVEMNPNAIMALQGHVQEHIGLMSEEQAQQQIMQSIPPEVQQNPQEMQAMMQQIQPQVDKIAAQIIADTVEQLSQSMETPPETDPLVEIRNKELDIKAADLQRKGSEFVARQEFDREKEINDNMIDQQRVAVSQEALRDKTRIAEDRIQTQRDIASLNARQKAN